MAYYDLVETPLGTVFVGGSAAGLHRMDFVTDRRDEAHYVARLERDAREPVSRDPQAARAAVEAVRAYFSGDESAWDALPELAARGTEFQTQVWRALTAIPRGSTVTYGEIATAIGRPSAARAVGRAIGTNPLAIVVPCHRVVGANGTLTGYASGVERKQWLLAHERVELAR
jgi:methylated-DNA-[protein]-cysteine S-methyltransferase